MIDAAATRRAMAGELRGSGGRVAQLLAGLLVIGLWAAPAMAQDEPGGEDEPVLPPVDPSDLATDAGQWMTQGEQYYDQGNFTAASLLFHRILSEPTASDGLHFRSEYELGRTLYHMRLYYGSVFFFEGITSYGPDHPYFVYAYPWLLRLSRRLPGEPSMLERASVYADFFPDQIEDKYRDHLAYLIGDYYYQRGLLDDAERFLGYVSSASRWYPRARYLMGIAHIQRYEGQDAANAFGDVISSVLESGDRSDETRKMGELAILAMARTLYSTRDYHGAVAYYDQVPASSRYWLDALFEKSWALFQLDEYNLSLGNLHSLNSPFFDDEFYPEGRILQAVIFFRNCNFDAVRETLEEFRLEYDPILEQLEDIVSGTADSDYFDLLVSLRGEQEQTFSPQLQRILNTALADQTVSDSLTFVEEMDRELLAIEGADPAWANTGLADELLTETGLSRSLGSSQAGENARIRIRRARDELRGMVQQSEAILVETDLAEQAVISEELRGELNLSDAGIAPPAIDGEHLLWHFAGEYWRDELGHYWYAIRSRCSELGL